MKILVTGSAGFVGRNLIESLKNIRDGKDRTRPNLDITDIYEYDVHTEESLLDAYCRDCDFVFNLAGVNRPKNQEEFMSGNFGFASMLLDTLRRYQNTCPIMLSSSIQATLVGRYADSEYGKSKLAGEELFFRYGQETGAHVLVYRFPNLFGKWCRPNYNSAVATFCNAIANEEEYTVNDRSTKLELLYIDNLVQEMLDALEGKEHHCDYNGSEKLAGEGGRFCYVPVTYDATLGEIVDLLESFRRMSDTLLIPEIPEGSFAKKLFSTYLSYLPEKAISYDLSMNVDNRGIFTELIKTVSGGQVSINIAHPGNVRGQHWHHSKWELFIVVSGHGLIQERKIGRDEKGELYPVHSFEVTGEKMKAVQMLPGYTHNIINLSDTEDLITVMWANEPFAPEHPDTYFEKVELCPTV
ncbi:MAG: SDR family oxidoreductase [Dorea sp.]|jgi:UDP-2-acetamido-2,6-beta-L-arabino-hexul-4-ose reductase|nr:SDR family oxidoreductase [Dorea sp.]